MNEYLISVIIPCYNSEKFVSKSVDSVLDQTISGYELILINDGSLDGTLEILRKYEENYERVTCIDLDHHGVSVARNTGIEHAKGKYISFLDSDDVMPIGTLEYFLRNINASPNVDFFTFGYASIRSGKKKLFISPHINEIFMEGEAFMKLYLLKKIPLNICSCLVRKDFLQQEEITFLPNLRMGEDIRWLLQVIQKATYIHYSNRICFHYLIRMDSVMQGYRHYSLSNFYSFLAIKDCLSDIPSQFDYSRNLFVSLSFISNLLLYWRSDLKSIDIEQRFFQERKVLHTPIRGFSFYHIAVHLFRLIPLRFFFLLK